MVITNIPFDASSRGKQSRYTVIRRPESGLRSDVGEDSREYATFLKDQERKCGNGAFLDSTKYTYTYEVKDGLPGMIARPGTPRAGHAKPLVPNSALSVNLTAEQEKKAYEARIKTIEDHMWQHKQDERDLKRLEGDVVKKRYALRHQQRDFETKIQKKRLLADQDYNKGMEKFTKLSQDHVHRQEELTKERLEKNVAADQGVRDTQRKVEVAMNDTARRFQTKQAELDLKRIEVNRLSSEYEGKLRRKEVEQHKLKNELTELAITLNMEMIKGREMKQSLSDSIAKEKELRLSQDEKERVELEKKLAKSDHTVKAGVANRRKLSAESAHTKARLALRNREEVRQLQDTRNELADNSVGQRKLSEMAVNAELDLKAKLIDKKLQVHEARKTVMMTEELSSKKERNELLERTLSEKFNRRYKEQQVKEHEDHLKHFQKMYVKAEEMEHSLYARVRETEYARQKQEQQMKKTQRELVDIRRRHSEKLKTMMTEMMKTEETLLQKSHRERAELDKCHASREECYEKLQKHRELVKTDRHNLEEHEREHIRLQKIAARSQQQQSNQMSIY